MPFILRIFLTVYSTSVFLTGVSPGAESTVLTPGHAVQAAALCVGGPAPWEGIGTHVVLHQALPADLHVDVMISS